MIYLKIKKGKGFKMKNIIKSSVLLVILLVVFLLVTKESYNNTLPASSSENASVQYCIVAYTNPECYGGTCTATRSSDGAIFSMPYNSSVGGYYTGASGLGVGTYTIKVCCGNSSGIKVTQITNTPQVWCPVETVNLSGGQCIPD